MIYEIRNYHYEPSVMAQYRTWAQKHALPHLRENLDLVGFWVNTDAPAQVGGKPLDELGSATVTWIIRWPDLDTRQRRFSEVFTSSAWQAIMKLNPGQHYYHRTEANFAEML